MLKLTDREVDVMMVIWEWPDERISTGEILQMISKAKRNSLQILQVVLRRLVEKDFLKCEKGKQKNFYVAAVSQKEYLKFATDNFLTVHYPNKTPFQYALQELKAMELDAADIREIEKIIEENTSTAGYFHKNP